MTAKDRKAFSESRLFSAIGEKTVSEWIKDKNLRIVSAEKGEIIMEEENFCRGLVLIISGNASVRKKSASGNETLINTLSEGDIFGMATLFYEKEAFPSEIIAESPLRLAFFRKEIIEEAFGNNPDFARAYVTLLSEKIHFLNRKLGDFSEGETSERLLRWITEASFGREEFALPCSVSRLAQMLGMGRASVYRAFENLEKRGIIRRKGKNIIFEEHPEKLL